MIVQSGIARSSKKKDFYKFWVVIPQRAVRKLEWKKGDYVDYKVKNGKLIISK